MPTSSSSELEELKKSINKLNGPDQKIKNALSFHFIINPVSGINKKLKIVEQLKSQLKNEVNYGISFTEKKSHATTIARKAIERNVDAVVAVGGDGTVSEVAKALVNSSIALGIIPCGSGNGFARHLNIPLDSSKAIEALLQFDVQKVDTVNVNNDVFIAFAGFGFDALISHKFNQSKQRGFLSYLQLSVSEFFSYKTQQFKLVVDGKKIDREAFLITIANVGQYGNNAWIAPKASLNDGQLDVCIIKPFLPHQAPDIIFKLFNKQLHTSEYYEHLRAKSIKVIQPKRFHLDGESMMSDEDLDISILPNSLNVIC